MNYRKKMHDDQLKRKSYAMLNSFITTPQTVLRNNTKEKKNNKGLWYSKQSLTELKTCSGVGKEMKLSDND